jgi:hypothetical protein
VAIVKRLVNLKEKIGTRMLTGPIWIETKSKLYVPANIVEDNTWTTDAGNCPIMQVTPCKLEISSWK